MKSKTRHKRKSSISRPSGLRIKPLYAIILLGVITVLAMLAKRQEAMAGRDSATEYGSMPGRTLLEKVVTNPLLDEQIVRYTGMTISFNPSMHIPNWVAYELTADEADGNEPRAGKFMADPHVDGCASPADYRNTGFDRGHMAPAADMKWSSDAMRESFYMTNIAPQDNKLNRGAWSNLEDKCRQRARRDSTIIIISGPVLTDPVEMHIGETGVAVPQRFFKVILSPYSETPAAIGFIMPNAAVKGGMQPCAVTVDEVEAVTGHDFFSALPDDIEDKVESTVNFNRWSRMQ
ncbi:MAG: DNA/RNA non-specific endonuclease [Clostridiales bacterium]|nr:DNA/RNA non-specific endonuclease [Clostridiales bacterium]